MRRAILGQPDGMSQGSLAGGVMTADEIQTLKAFIHTEVAASADRLQEEMAASADRLREEMAASADRLRTELRVLGDELRGGIALVAEGHAALDDTMRALGQTTTRIGERVEGIDLNVIWLRRRIAILAAAGTHPNRGRSG